MTLTVTENPLDPDPNPNPDLNAFVNPSPLTPNPSPNPSPGQQASADDGIRASLQPTSKPTPTPPGGKTEGSKAFELVTPLTLTQLTLILTLTLT